MRLIEVGVTVYIWPKWVRRFMADDKSTEEIIRRPQLLEQVAEIKSTKNVLRPPTFQFFDRQNNFFLFLFSAETT